MQSHKVISTSMSILLVVEALLSITAIALLSRMIPSSEEATLHASEAMQDIEDMTIALAGTSSAAERREQFLTALARVKETTKDPKDRTMLTILEGEASHNFSENVDAARRQHVLSTLRALAASRSNGADRSLQKAMRAGRDGAWASVIVGLLALLVTVVLWRRINTQLVRPLDMIEDVLSSCGEGDRHRRCTVSTAHSLTALASRINDLLDSLHPREPRRNLARLDRALLLHLLDERSAPTVAVAISGEVVVANQAALQWLEQEDQAQILQQVRRIVTNSEPSSEFEIVEVTRGELWLVSRKPQADPMPGQQLS